MRFRHSPQVRSAFPELVCGVLHATGVTSAVDVGPPLTRHADAARARLATGPESGFPEIQAWRRAFTRMGLAPTRYRCAAESLLRRFRQGPDEHPLHLRVVAGHRVQPARSEGRLRRPGAGDPGRRRP